jgi:uncharacterized membrane protein
MRAVSDRQVEVFIGEVLRTGVIVAAVLTVVGFALYLLHFADAQPHYLHFIPLRGRFYFPSMLFHLAASGHTQAIMELGILILIATPVARVAFLIGAFALQRDRLYIGVSSVVLLVLLFSLIFMK